MNICNMVFTDNIGDKERAFWKNDCKWNSEVLWKRKGIKIQKGRILKME